MTKKTIIMTFIIILIIVLGIGIYNFHRQESLSINPGTENKTIINESAEPDEPTETIDETNEKPNTPAAELSQEFSSAIENTIKFFSGSNTQIVAIGDSLTQGVGDSTRQGGYVGILDKNINHGKRVATFENLGKRGNQTTHLLKRLKEPAIKRSLKNTDIVLITIGANDIMQVAKENFTEMTYDIFAEERVYYEDRLQTIFSSIIALNPDASIYLIGFYNPFQQYFEHIKELDMIVDDWNNTSKQVAEEYGATFIPTKDIFMNEETNLFADDHFHPNEQGYQLMAERILDYLVVD
ncbi:SGNH/GDSL hydrolase family protein [Paucisalibacillus sp. EB02]|uniref:SGNH/GDSL hydrolase family protein n=1 Tax=Paucisalibacillus sp. EB02 TaxID=1347087 RepID=UPI0004BBDE6E|nr:SGNH/GDSL hydrolase family protein [Paucisalibacillus sp. EB02]